MHAPCRDGCGFIDLEPSARGRAEGCGTALRLANGNRGVRPVGGAGLKSQLQTWASEVSEVLNRSASGRMVSEWAKKPECWAVVKEAGYSPIDRGIRELQ
jgi:hypothetical protein